MLSEHDIIEVLKTIYDPEIPVNIYDLGLIYDVKTKDSEVLITMTLTTATCPAAAIIPEEVMNSIRTLPGVSDVNVHIVYEPKWTRERMSTAARQLLGYS